VNIYIACALTHVPRQLFPAYTAFIHQVAAELTAKGDPSRLVKYALMHTDPQLAAKPFEQRARLCYLWDRALVEEADLLIAEATFPAIGLGIELQLAESRNTPIIICFRDYGKNRAAPVSYENPDHTRHNLQIGSGYVSLMALGLPSVFRVVQYTDTADGVAQILDAVALFEQT
jgi:hypothetical protein